MITPEQLELAKVLISIYKHPRRAYAGGPLMPINSQDLIIVKALEFYVNNT